ncbi:hypothetical protein MNEG_9310 [Monoraphidium neglectum]|uniref:Acyltransferase n=1 Tax=Monoraphidium neglectum TaxID=145388 RepID=A0A0D2KT58_9CHLO|nr:hypothetical protein MNEG_9310 [Monoraphidium neglectum]KIY98653.1 hypothetical protein MNEG_9310 [Monoraphidium neglectum]|eukprot:XP_013897673.1 hypothetical protein MNEG_9310 [Monoraphidium neglectum]
MAVSAEIQIRRPKGGAAAPASRRGWTLSSLLREAARQLLPEPRPAPAAYEHPSQYTRACRGVCYSDGMYPGYRPTLFTRIFAGATLGVYLAVPYIIGLIALAAVWSAWARGAAALVLATYLLPLGPVMVRRVLDAYVFLAWRRYFRFSFVFDEPLDAYKDYIIAQFPHGAFPLEMYLQHPDFERVKLLGRKGFVRVAVEHGADILPVFMFGVSQMMSFGPPWLMVIGRRLRMSVGLLYGLWGTPVPRPRRMRMAVGPPVRVGPPLARGTPEFEARVDAVHAEVVEGLRAVYYRHREAYGWGDRELLIV